MKQKFYQYSILKYRPSLLLDEQVAIGLLFVFIEDRRVEFIFPTHLTRRLSSLYPNTNTNLIKTHLKAFERRATELSSKPLYVEGKLSSLIESEFLQTDSNSLFFTDFKVGSYLDANATIEYYRQEFFALYDTVEDEKRQYDDVLVRNFERRLKEKNRSKAHLFVPNYTVGKGKVAFKFDYGWQNGHVNAVKFLSFDLKDADSLIEKSSRWYGKVMLLNEEKEAADTCFDFFVSRPKNRQLFDAYDTALTVLGKITSDKRIYEEDRHEEYIESALSEVRELV